MEEALTLQQELCALLELDQMKLQKWRMSSSELLSSIPEELCEKTPVQLPSTQQHIKMLGIHWDTAMDVFYIPVPEMQFIETLTKCQLASVISKLFDILRWLTPATLQAKMLLQQLWKLDIG